MKRWLGTGRLSLRAQRVKTGAGYTVVEVMIVLATTTLMFVGVAMLLAGRQSRAEFTQAVRNFEAKLQSSISEVANGAYSSATNCSATGNSGAPVVGTGANTPGSCIFVGKLFDLTDADTRTTSVATLVGRRTFGPSRNDTTTLAQAAPVLLPDRDNYRHSFQLSLAKAVLTDGTSIPAFGFVVPLAGSGSLAPNQGSGSQQVVLYGLNNAASLTLPGNILNEPQFVPLPGGVRLCLRGANGQWAEIEIGTGTSGDSLLNSQLDTPHTGVCSG